MVVVAERVLCFPLGVNVAGRAYCRRAGAPRSQNTSSRLAAELSLCERGRRRGSRHANAADGGLKRPTDGPPQSRLTLCAVRTPWLCLMFFPRTILSAPASKHACSVQSPRPYRLPCPLGRGTVCLETSPPARTSPSVPQSLEVMILASIQSSPVR
ncbi:hypothetical protein PYCCODRAFT_120503 [Trametes coccinea BRFM310]|uniref:Uncharacterized protein n=1 Tax=Trametes coccinea (strain BRFM310) TaxID=1353009 RepID=A0A1Y2IU95_TRAC3|nr:hypothetical protein PYCCODRAFT_120503 [Trametes coccinea BRFM310]